MDTTTEFVNKLLANYHRSIADLINQNIILQTQLQVANERLANLEMPATPKKKPRADKNDESF